MWWTVIRMTNLLQEEIRLNIKKLFLKKGIMRREHPGKVVDLFSQEF